MNDLNIAVLHDVKNQLAELSSRLRRRGDAPVEMEIALNASRRLSEMLLMDRDDHDRLWVNADSVNPGDFLEILASEYQELFPQLDIVVASEQAPAFAFFDAALISMALGNALHNACRHAKARVRLEALSQGSMLVLQVCDDGPGFPESVLSSCGALPSAVNRTGTGLGLYLANRIAAMHKLDAQHGHIELSNAGNGQSSGGLFRMILP